MNAMKNHKHPAKQGKSRKQQDEDEFEKLLSDLNKVTRKAGEERSKQQITQEKQRRDLEERHTAILERTKKNDVEQALLARQQELQFQKIMQQIMMGQRSFLNEPNTEFKSETVTSNPHFNIAVGEMQGWRAKMEDDHVIDVTFPSTTESTEGLFCVFDGHSGVECANACHKLFPAGLRKYATKNEDGTHSINFEAAFLELDERIATVLQTSAGCTAVAVHVTPKHVTCASVGDSRAVLCRNGNAFDLSHDHKPELPAERKRIESLGGFVQDNRVNGQLAMSRAMGDITYKAMKDTYDATEQFVIAVPDVISTERDSATDSFVVLACDGIFDVMSNQELIEFIGARKEEGLNNVDICKALCDHCLSPMSTSGMPERAEGTDNMTVMIVDLL